MDNRAMLDWNDLRYLLAVARVGSTIAAGKALGRSQFYGSSPPYRVGSTNGMRVGETPSDWLPPDGIRSAAVAIR